MIQKTINVYSLDELKKEIQEKVINSNREINTYDGWFNFCLGDITQEIEDKTGLKINSKDIEFEIFSRSNRILIASNIIVNALIDKYPKIESFYLPKNFGSFCNYLGGDLCSSLIQSEIDIDEIVFFNEFDKEELEAVIEEKENAIIKGKVKADLNIIQEMLKKGYENIIKEYGYLTSDEAIKDTIIINEYEFDENGKRI